MTDIPGCSLITTFFTFQNLNIEQQINTSRGEIAYTVIDFGKVDDPAGLQVGGACGAVSTVVGGAGFVWAVSRGPGAQALQGAGCSPEREHKHLRDWMGVILAKWRPVRCGKSWDEVLSPTFPRCTHLPHTAMHPPLPHHDAQLCLVPRRRSWQRHAPPSSPPA